MSDGILSNFAGLSALDRKQLTKHCKRHGIPVKGKNVDLAEKLFEYGQNLPQIPTQNEPASSPPASPPEKMVVPRQLPETARPNTLVHRLSMNLRNSISSKRQSQYKPYSRQYHSLDIDRNRTQQSESWEVLTEADTSMQTVLPGRVVVGRRSIDSGGSRSWKSAENGLTKGVDEFGNRLEGSTQDRGSLTRKSINSLREMASSISLRGKAPSSNLKKRRSMHLRSTFNQPDIQSQPQSIRNRAKTDYLSQDRLETLIQSPAVNPPSPTPTETVCVPKRHRGSVVNGPSTIRMVPSGSMLRGSYAGSQMAGKTSMLRGKNSTIRGIDVRGGASIPMMWQDSARPSDVTNEDSEMDSPTKQGSVSEVEPTMADWPYFKTLPPLRLSKIYPVMGTPSTRRSSIGSTTSTFMPHADEDVPPLPNPDYSIADNSDANVSGSFYPPLPNELIAKSPELPGSFPTSPNETQPFVFGSQEFGITNDQFSLASGDVLREMQARMGSSVSASNLIFGRGGTNGEDNVDEEERRRKAKEWERGVLEKGGRVGGQMKDRYEDSHQKQFAKMTSLSKKPSANHLNTSTLTDFHGQKRKVSASDLTSKAIAQQAAENFVTEYGTPTKKARVESEDTMRKSKLVGRTRRSPSKRSGLAKSTATAAAGSAGRFGFLSSVKESIFSAGRRLASGPEIMLATSGAEPSDPKVLPGGYPTISTPVEPRAERPKMSRQPSSLVVPVRHNLSQSTGPGGQQVTGVRQPNRLKESSSTMTFNGQASVQASTQPPRTHLSTKTTDYFNLPTPSMHASMTSKQSTKSTMSTKYTYSKSSRPAPPAPGSMEGRSVGRPLASSTSTLYAPTASSLAKRRNVPEKVVEARYKLGDDDEEMLAIREDTRFEMRGQGNGRTKERVVSNASGHLSRVLVDRSSLDASGDIFRPLSTSRSSNGMSSSYRGAVSLSGDPFTVEAGSSSTGATTHNPPKHLRGGANAPHLKSPTRYHQRSTHKTASPSRRSAAVGGLKHQPSGALLRMEARHQELQGKRRLMSEQRKLEEMLNM